MKSSKNTKRDPTPSAPIRVTSLAAIAAELGISRSLVHSARRRFPDTPRPDTKNTHSVEEWRSWFAHHPELRPRSPATRADLLEAGGTRMSKSQADEAWANERARKLKLANDEKERSLLKRDTVERVITSAISGARSLLVQKMLNEWPFSMEGLTAPVIAERMKIEEQQIHEEMRKMFRSIPEVVSKA